MYGGKAAVGRIDKIMSVGCHLAQLTFPLKPTTTTTDDNDNGDNVTHCKYADALINTSHVAAYNKWHMVGNANASRAQQAYQLQAQRVLFQVLF